MNLQDAPEAARLEAAGFSLPWTLADFEYEMRSNPVARYVVAEQDGRLLGFAGAHMIFEESHVTNVVVDETVRGLGIGRALMQSLMQYAANLGGKYMTLEVRASNQPAINLYKSLGFFKVWVRPKYYTDNQEDAWVMVCDRLPEIEEDFSEQPH
ncbi:MAG: ribosomal protein S18-alanine N-acetyltransferase [Christensenellales bacterium]|jgi:ribosomal-protein-alanine N-acetyltransferase